MKSKLIALALFGATAATLACFPAIEKVNALTGNTPPAFVNPLANERSNIEVVFVLDTTGSMGGMIEAAKEKIWSIASSMASAQTAPEIKMGLVAYRDRGDEYVTRIVDLSADLDSVYAALMDFRADGGGDGPESVNQALYDAVHRLSWSRDPQTYKVVFLVGDAPPHMDYQDDVKYPDTLAAALQKDILVNTIQCGQSATTSRQWNRIARLGKGRYFQVAQAGSAVAIATPFDSKLAELSEQLDDTRLYYGSAQEKAKREAKLKASKKLHKASSLESRARRAAFNNSASGRRNLLGEGELVEDVASGRLDLSTVDRAELPASLQAMEPARQQAVIQEKARRRDELQRRIGELSAQRARYLKEKVEERGSARASLDHKLYSTVREQAAAKGMKYDADTPAY